MTLAATTQKLGGSFGADLQDRLHQAGRVPPVADLIRARAAPSTSAPPGPRPSPAASPGLLCGHDRRDGENKHLIWPFNVAKLGKFELIYP